MLCISISFYPSIQLHLYHPAKHFDWWHWKFCLQCPDISTPTIYSRIFTLPICVDWLTSLVCTKAPKWPVKSVRNGFFNIEAYEQNSACVLQFWATEGCISQPHMEEPLEWPHLFVRMHSVLKCGFWKEAAPELRQNIKSPHKVLLGLSC